MAPYTGPDPVTLRARLTKLVHEGMDPEWILEVGGELLQLRVVTDRLPPDHEPDDDSGEAEGDPLVEAFSEVINAAIKQIGSKPYRRLLRSVLGIYEETRELPLQERRASAGRHFRGKESKRNVSGETIRTHHEPKALDQLSVILVAMEAEHRGEDRPTTVTTEQT